MDSIPNYANWLETLSKREAIPLWRFSPVDSQSANCRYRTRLLSTNIPSVTIADASIDAYHPKPTWSKFRETNASADLESSFLSRFASLSKGM